MKNELKEKLLEVAPMLYKYFKDNPKNVIDCPDDTDTLRKILEYAEKRTIVPQDHADLANWRKKYLNDEEKNDLFHTNSTFKHDV